MACKECDPYGGLWRMAASGEGLERCTACEEGKRAAETAAQRTDPGQPPILDKDSALAFCEMLAGAVKYFPGSGLSRGLIAEEIRSMCRNQDEALWLVQRMGRLYTDWPGAKEMRRVYCAKHIPLDGVIDTTESLAYPDGIPSERLAPPEPRGLLWTGERRQLAGPAEEPSVSPDKVQQAVKQMVRRAHRMPSGAAGGDRFEETPREITTAPQDRPQLPGPAPQIITPEQADREAREYREKRARGERMPWEEGERKNA